MSGGFFRGTSADQDTRFSDKQAKLLKSQKFASELDHLVDITKVKMDVMRPWIATRTTELLGFEDEVLINFIYGLLDQKLVDGKKIQIQLTGFMEKNTVKFMKELWGLLLSAQENASGVPQQFLDAKEKEMREKKAEADRITQEIQRRKDREVREREVEKKNKMDVEPDVAKHTKPTSDLVAEPLSPRGFSRQPKEVDEKDGRHDHTIRKHTSSPESNDHSLSPLRARSPARSSSNSYSKSKSYSRNGHKSRSRSRSISYSPTRRYKSPKRRSISPDVLHKSTRGRPISPHHRSSPPKTRSPTRWRSPYTRRRSNSRSRRRSPSPIRRRSPYLRRRSPPSFYRRSPIQDRSSPPRRRSRTPRRSPRKRSPPITRRRSRSPLRRTSPLHKSPSTRQRSPTPSRRRSPQRRPPLSRRRSPTSRRSPQRRSPFARPRSPTPSRRRSPQRRSPLTRRRSATPARMISPRRMLSSPGRRRSNTPSRRRSPRRRSPVAHSPSRTPSPRRGSPYSRIKKSVSSASGKSSSPSRSPPSRSPKQKMLTVPSPRKVKVDPQTLIRQRYRSHSSDGGQSPAGRIGRGSNGDHIHHSTGVEQFRDYYVSERSHSLSESPVKQRREQMTNPKSKEISKDEDEISDCRENIPDETYSRNKTTKHDPAARMKKLGQSDAGHYDKKVGHVSPTSEEREYGPGTNLKETHSPDFNANKKIDSNNLLDTIDSRSEDSDDGHRKLEKQRHKKSHGRKRECDDDDDDSGRDERKEAKRKRKDEKRQRKEEKRQRREERRQKKLERRSAKLRVKSMINVTPPSGYEENQVSYTKRDSHSSDAEGTESEQKRLEIELRNKALESLKAKKATSH
ncbi:serine/arginine repetitive matrix protein 1 isoform X2 [Dioscorea cayenensis subsp. rotundata]|uniref:Serine/arginine repetitive matrix protein 1 isoform X2 n=1 Tax=Dioscorea cayennensis subsp. rotundata TaxID=55577 RepID=A0AB40C894_DIOCR|nr:serine/arginine repetitive matrix protein 1 isoform X2 [Dioscorea cayenensis subsp. rotundata]